MIVPLPSHIKEFDPAEIVDLERVPVESNLDLGTKHDGYSFTFKYRGVAFGPACFANWTMVADTQATNVFSIAIGWWDLAKLWDERNAEPTFQVDDVVTRTGMDRHVVTAVRPADSKAPLHLEVRCEGLLWTRERHDRPGRPGVHRGA